MRPFVAPNRGVQRTGHGALKAPRSDRLATRQSPGTRLGLGEPEVRAGANECLHHASNRACPSSRLGQRGVDSSTSDVPSAAASRASWELHAACHRALNSPTNAGSSLASDVWSAWPDTVSLVSLGPLCAPRDREVNNSGHPRKSAHPRSKTRRPRQPTSDQKAATWRYGSAQQPRRRRTGFLVKAKAGALPTRTSHPVLAQIRGSRRCDAPNAPRTRT